MPSLDKLPVKNNRLLYRGNRLISDCCCGSPPGECGCCFPLDPGQGSECVDYSNPGGREACENAGGIPYLLRYPGVPESEYICVPCDNTVTNIVAAFGEYGITVGPGNVSLLFISCSEPGPPCDVCTNHAPLPEHVALRMQGAIRHLHPAVIGAGTPSERSCGECPPFAPPICLIPQSCWDPMRDYYTNVINAMMTGTIGGGVLLDRNPNQPCCYSFAASAIIPEGPQCLRDQLDAMGVAPENQIFPFNIAATYCVTACGGYLGVSFNMGGWAEHLTCFLDSLFTFVGEPACFAEDIYNCPDCNIVDEHALFDVGAAGPTGSISDATAGTLDWALSSGGVPRPWRFTVGAC